MEIGLNNKGDSRCPRVEDLAAKVSNIERQIIEGKLVLMGEDGDPLKPLKAGGLANIMEEFPCLSNSLVPLIHLSK